LWVPVERQQDACARLNQRHRGEAIGRSCLHLERSVDLCDSILKLGESGILGVARGWPRLRPGWNSMELAGAGEDTSLVPIGFAFIHLIYLW
jgi:hypothetical protein